MVRRARFAPLALAAAVIVTLLSSSARAEGVLTARGPGGQDRGLFPLERTEVRAEVTGKVTAVSVTQRYRNPFAERIEAVYVFPLPTDAAVDEMEMRAGARVVRAQVRRRGEARELYDRARDQGHQAALLEQERPNVFTFSVANIEPGGEIEVRLRYFALARYDHGTYEMVFPMVVGPRYVPGAPLAGPQSGGGTQGDTDRVPDASRISPAYVPPGTRSGHAIALSVRLDAGAEIQSLEAPAHDVVIDRPTPTAAQVALRDKDEIPNRDFVLRWRLAAPELRTAVFAHRPDPRQEGYVAVLLEPRHDVPVEEIAPREIVFLLDTSGSMAGEPLATSLRAVRRVLDTLGPQDTFQVIDFADTTSNLAPRPLANTPENLRRARAYLDSLRASGGTNQLAGIHAALSAPGDASRVRYVVFMTDGYIGNETEVVGLVQREIGNARIFSFGVGSSVNRFLLEEVALAGRGAARGRGRSPCAGAWGEGPSRGSLR
jgi:Ca-activated chloride channel family protein